MTRACRKVLATLQPGEELTITDAHRQAVALVKKANAPSWPSQAGTAKDRAFWLAPDFDARLGDFKKSME